MINKNKNLWSNSRDKKNVRRKKVKEFLISGGNKARKTLTKVYRQRLNWKLYPKHEKIFTSVKRKLNYHSKSEKLRNLI